MLLKLDVLASTTIKRKKPWPNFAWLGKVSLENADRTRIVDKFDNVAYIKQQQESQPYFTLGDHAARVE